jgi:hypothetical protein
LIFGISLGWQRVDWDYGYNILYYLNTHPTFHVDGIPLFLITNAYPFILYCSGIHILLTIGTYELVDKYQKICRVGMFEMYGKYSLTIYFIQYLFFLIPIQFPSFLIWVGLLIVGGSLYLLVFLIDRFSWGVYSLEQVMQVTADFVYKKWTGKMIEKSYWKEKFTIPKKISKNN